MPRNSSKENATATRAQIIVAATHLFAARGVAATSLDRIAGAVGIRKASLLYHFTSKSGLHEAVLDELLARWRDVLPRLLMAAATGWERFDAVLDEVEDYFAADPARARVLLRELLDRPESMSARFRQDLEPWLTMTAKYISRGQVEGVIHEDVDATVYVLMMVQTILATFAVSDAVAGNISALTSEGSASDEVPVRSPQLAEAMRQRFHSEMKRIARAALFKSNGVDSA